MTNEGEALSRTVGCSAGLWVGSAAVPVSGEGERVREQSVHGRKNENAPR